MVTMKTMLTENPNILESLSANVDFLETAKVHEIVNGIFLECGELFPVYSDPDIFRNKVENWVVVNVNVWEKLDRTNTLKYNPLSNSDKTVEWETDTNGNTENKTNANSTNINKVKAFDSGVLSESASQTLTDGGSGTIKTENKMKHKFRSSGNSGSVTMQNLVEQERKIATFNLIKIIVDNFKENFCIMVY